MIGSVIGCDGSECHIYQEVCTFTFIHTAESGIISLDAEGTAKVIREQLSLHIEKS